MPEAAGSRFLIADPYEAHLLEPSLLLAGHVPSTRVTRSSQFETRLATLYFALLIARRIEQKALGCGLLVSKNGVVPSSGLLARTNRSLFKTLGPVPITA